MTDARYRVTLARQRREVTAHHEYAQLEIVAPTDDVAKAMGLAAAQSIPADRWVQSSEAPGASVEYAYDQYAQAEAVQTSVDPHVTMVAVSAALDRIRDDLADEGDCDLTESQAAVLKGRTDLLDQIVRELQPGKATP